MPTRHAALYARVSTEEQTRGLVASLDTQIERLRTKAAALNLPIAEQYVVKEQHSGADLRWQGTGLMMLANAAAEGAFTDLLVLDIDRFCRAGYDAYKEQKRYFSDSGVTLHFVMLDLPPDMPFREIVEHFVADASQWVRDKTREASVRNREQWAQQGNIVRGKTPPFGFQFVYDETRRTKRNLPLVIGLVPDPLTAPALLHMTEHVANGLSLGALKVWLDAEHIPTPGGAPIWHPETIRRILRNDTNCGQRTSHRLRREKLVDAHTREQRRVTDFTRVRGACYPVDTERVVPIPGLTVDLWQRAVDRLAMNATDHERRASLPEHERVTRALLYGGAARCAVCGGGMRVKRHNLNGGYMYYCAHNGTPHEGEPSVGMLAAQVDTTIWRIAVDAMRDPAFFERIVRQTHGVNAAAVRATSLRSQLDENEHDQQRTLKKLRKLDPDDPEDAAYEVALKRDLRELSRAHAGLEQAYAVVARDAAAEVARRASLLAFHDFAAERRETLDQLLPLDQRRILLALTTQVQIAPTSLASGASRLRIRFDVRHLPGKRVFAAPLLDVAPADVVDAPEPVYIDLHDTPSVEICDDVATPEVLASPLRS